jgi:hypothetical protein
MKIGILGTGRIGTAMARQTAKAGYETILSYSRGPESLAEIVRELGPLVKAGTREEAARADVVIIAVRWAHVQHALAGVGDWNGRIVIDSTNAVEGEPPNFKFPDLGGRTSSEIIASFVPGARVVKAGNTLLAATLAADAKEAGGRRVLFISGDDAPAKKTVSEIFEKAGFAPIDLGSLATGGSMQQLPGGRSLD